MRAVVLCFLLACATGEPALVPPTPTRLQAVPPRVFDARSFAAEHFTPADCEVGARHIRQDNPEQGWEALRACVDRTRWPRGEFTQLERLTGGFWDQDLQGRPDAPRLIAKVIALRGGDVEGDIPLAQKSRVPLFTLAAAMSQPNVYKGRWVVLRGALGQVQQEGGKSSATLKETSLRATAHDRDVGESRHSSTSARGGNVEIRRRDGDSIRMQNGARLESESYSSVRRFDNERSETGRQAVARLPQADPFLEPEKDFIFIGRFDGLKPGNDDNKAMAVITLSAYFSPNALMVQ